MKIAIVLYVLSMTAANLLVAKFGPGISPVLAFFLIGLDLSLRDYLHEKLRAVQMLCMIVVGGLLTYVLNPAAGMIAIASAVAFTSAALVDWSVYVRTTGSWLKKANSSNVVGAAVDSLVFPTVAFGMLMPQIVISQFAAKVVGGAIWAWAINRYVKA